VNFGFIPDLITIVEKSGVPINESIRHVDEAFGLLNAAGGDIASLIQLKIDVFSKKAGLRTLRQISDILEGRSELSGVEGYQHSPAELAAYKFAPLVSCDVERSFSKLKALLRDNRAKLTFEHLKQYLVVNCN
jgi:hypothetical protein